MSTLHDSPVPRLNYPTARFLISAPTLALCPDDTGAEVAFAGRSNAGKSSAINLITQRHGLARTSKTPGQTQLVNFFELEPGRRLVDLPGYGFAKVPREMQDHWGRLLARYFAERQTLYGGIRRTERFDKYDTEEWIGYYHPLKENTNRFVKKRPVKA